MLGRHLLSEGRKDKVFQMCWKIVILVQEADFVFWLGVGCAESWHLFMLIVVSLNEKMELSDE